MTTALVTGAGGFVGGHLAAALRRHGASRLVGADIRGAGPPGFDAWLTTDLTDASAVRRLVETAVPSVVIHLVGSIRGSDAEIRASNVATAANVIDAVRAGPRTARVVLVGSAAEYGRVPPMDQPVRESFAGVPTSAYGRAKREVSALAARAAHEEGLHVVVGRPFNILGPGMPGTLVAGAIAQRLRAALAGPPPRMIRVGTTTSVRDFVDAQDVAEGLVLAAARGRPGEAYNLCSGEGHSVGELLERLLTLAGEPVDVAFDAGLVRDGEVDQVVGNGRKSAAELEWEPRVPFGASVLAVWESARPQGAER